MNWFYVRHYALKGNASRNKNKLVNVLLKCYNIKSDKYN